LICTKSDDTHMLCEDMFYTIDKRGSYSWPSPLLRIYINMLSKGGLVIVIS